MRKASQLLMLVLVVAALGVALAACGDEPTPEEAKDQLVTDLQAFETTVTDELSSLSVDSTVDEWAAARDDVRAAWDTVVKSAADVKEAELTDVQTAWDDLAASIDDLGDTPLSEAFPSLTEEIDTLKAAYRDLLDGLK